MSDISWQALEEKIVTMITENERLRKENATLRHERDLYTQQYTQRLYDLISLIDSANTLDSGISPAAIAMHKPVLVQG